MGKAYCYIPIYYRGICVALRSQTQSKIYCKWSILENVLGSNTALPHSDFLRHVVTLAGMLETQAISKAQCLRELKCAACPGLELGTSR